MQNKVKLEAFSNAKLYNSTPKLSKLLLKRSTLAESTTSDNENPALDLKLTFSSDATVEIRNGVLVPKGNGDAIVHAFIFASGTRLSSGVNAGGQTLLASENIFNTLPASLIKQIGIPVYISGQPSDAGGSSTPGGLANTGLWIVLLLLMLVIFALACAFFKVRNCARN
ncbi:MAG: hypothetical protein LBP35_02870 [Candidatus Ancillula trichonymphae]|nr:hypothetical protein [Candidatus Ancillula trichonymphae]